MATNYVWSSRGLGELTFEKGKRRTRARRAARARAEALRARFQRDGRVLFLPTALGALLGVGGRGEHARTCSNGILPIYVVHVVRTVYESTKVLSYTLALTC